MRILSIEEAKPCPFCGRQPELRHTVEDDEEKWKVRCGNVEDHMSVATRKMPTVEEALNLWNRRVGDKHEAADEVQNDG